MATVTKPIALDESLNTTEQTPRNIADVLAQELSRITGRNASQVEYDNTDSGLTADNVQDAIDELSERPTLPSVDVQTAVDEFSTYNGGLLSSLKVTLTPNQDLHGYAEPWVGGSKKNKLPLVLADIKSANTSGTWSGNAYTANGTTFTVNTDDEDNVISIDVANAPSATTAFIVYTSSINPFDTNLSYILNGCPNGGGASTRYKLDFIYEKNGSLYTLLTDTGSSAQEAFSQLVGATSVMVRIVIYTNASLPKTFYPMLRLSTESDPTFEPYSNICPITGHTEIKIGDDGKNRAIPPENGVFSGVNGAFNPADTYAYVVANVEPNKLYTVSAEHRGGIGYVLFYKGTLDTPVTNFISAISIGDVASYTFTTPEECTVVVYETGGSAIPINKDTIGNVQIELGSTATSYVPYNGYQVTVNLGGTYYSGILDVVTGVFVPDTASVDLGSLTWTYDSGTQRFTTSVSGLKNYPVRTEPMDCEVYQVITDGRAIADVPDGSIYNGNMSTNVYVHDSRFTVPSDLATVLSGYKLVYPLATPQTIQLSPTMVKALVGENHLSAPLDGQEITECKYKQMFTFDDVIAYIQSLS